MTDALVLRLIGVDGFGCSEPVFAAFQQHWRTLLDVEIRHHRAKRSLDQNAWVWGVAYPPMAKALGYEPHELEELHYGLVAKWGGEHFDKRLREMVPNKRSSNLTTKEFSDYMEWLVRFAAKECGGVLITLPDER